ncbi:beta-class carbonic anhydrase [Haloarcula laminariae]|uniref:beta-class carbonic anhydrase n=1 Tax=Haloarcula laminariae TaxID=2961577 RepID=UPI0021C9943F|nr:MULTISPECIES: carbonic anhydrase [Halomicroarcula]
MAHHTHEHNSEPPEAGHVHEWVDDSVDARDDWARRRRKDIPNDKQLFVLACMDERIPIEEVLGLELGDAHIFRNAGGKVTDDVIRSAALTLQFFDTEEIIVVNHTDCGMMSAADEDIVGGLEAAVEGDIDDVDLDPALPELNIGDASIAEWVRMTDNIDEACAAQVSYLENHPLIPDVPVTGYVYEVESGHLRRPGEHIGEEISERV